MVCVILLLPLFLSDLIKEKQIQGTVSNHNLNRSTLLIRSLCCIWLWNVYCVCQSDSSYAMKSKQKTYKDVCLWSSTVVSSIYYTYQALGYESLVYLIYTIKHFTKLNSINMKGKHLCFLHFGRIRFWLLKRNCAEYERYFFIPIYRRTVLAGLYVNEV